MIVRTQEWQHPCVVVHMAALIDVRLSFRARGIHTYCMSKPDDWQISVRDLVSQSPNEDVAAIRAALQELQSYGYIKFQPHYYPNGTFSRWEMVLYETSRETPLQASEETSLPLVARRRRRRTRRTPLPETHEGQQQLNEAIRDAHFLAWWASKALALDLEAEWERFTLDARAHNRKYADWQAAFQKWLLSEYWQTYRPSHTRSDYGSVRERGDAAGDLDS